MRRRGYEQKLPAERRVALEVGIGRKGDEYLDTNKGGALTPEQCDEIRDLVAQDIAEIPDLRDRVLV